MWTSGAHCIARIRAVHAGWDAVVPVTPDLPCDLGQEKSWQISVRVVGDQKKVSDPVSSVGCMDKGAAQIAEDAVAEAWSALAPVNTSLSLAELDEKELLDLVADTQRLATRAKAAALVLLAELDRRGTCETTFGVGTASWLADQTKLAHATARAEVRTARELTDTTPVVADALCCAELTLDHAKAIVYGLGIVPLNLPADEDQKVQRTLVAFARSFTPLEVRRLTNHAVQVCAPDLVDDYQARLLAAQEAAAKRSQSLHWQWTEHGTLRLRGLFSSADGDKLIAAIAAVATSGPTGDDQRDEHPAPLSARRADALVEIVDRYAATGAAPNKGGDRPRITVLIDHQALVSGLGAASLLGSGESLSVSAMRHLACDAGILPIVCDSSSAILDVGRTKRLFTGTLRAGILVRDRGCTFPGCPRPTIDCDIHHIVPWWAGGATSMANAATLCPHHHKIVEPQPNAPPGSRWEVELDSHGLPQYRPPKALDPERQPRQHSRFAVQNLPAA